MKVEIVTARYQPNPLHPFVSVVIRPPELVAVFIVFHYKGVIAGLGRQWDRYVQVWEIDIPRLRPIAVKVFMVGTGRAKPHLGFGYSRNIEIAVLVHSLNFDRQGTVWLVTRITPRCPVQLYKLNVLVAAQLSEIQIARVFGIADISR